MFVAIIGNGNTIETVFWLLVFILLFPMIRGNIPA
jgi:hypothetical protein